MSKVFLLKAEVRRHAGSKHATKFRREGKIPAIVYGHKQGSVSICLDAHDFTEGLHHGHRLIDVEFGGRKEKMLVKDVQYDYLGKNIIHADLMRVDITELIKVAVPIELRGTAQGSHEGGIINEHTDHIEIECKASDIPETIVVSVKDIDVGESIHAGDVELPAGVKMISDPETLIVNCSLVAAAKSTEELEEQAPVEPEVIGEAEQGGEEESASKEQE